MNNPRLVELRNKALTDYYSKFRRNIVIDIQEETDCSQISWEKQVSMLFRAMVENEKALIEDDEKIIFRRTLQHPINPVPLKYQEEEKLEQKQLIGNRVHNVCSNWDMLLRQGLSGRRRATFAAMDKYGDDPEKRRYLECVLESLESISILVNKYKECAKELKREDICEILENVPENTPKSFHEALQSLRILHGVLWMNGHNHVGFGRFDQYMWPYLEADLKKRFITLDEAEELLMEFFISVNKDTNVYPGIQRGDNGQTLILGGVTVDGKDAENPLTGMTLKVASDLGLADPKINLRIHSNTNSEILELAAGLVQRGLGFPQFSNDDIVIPALVKNGYELQDARNYVVAACWEFIIPGKGKDVPNINALSFPAEVDKAIREGLQNQLEFEQILEIVKERIHRSVWKYIENKKYIRYWPPSPLYSSFMSECIERALDINNGGAEYNNYGIHGAGSAHAADALAAVHKLVYKDKVVKPLDFLSALDSNWEGKEELRELVKNKCPKVGNNDDEADVYLTLLFDYFSEACENSSAKLQKNNKDIIIRPGTGTAMFYLWLVKEKRQNQLEPIVGATADGRKIGDLIAANLAPSIGIKTNGPLSCLMSFSKINYQKVYNGGPITMELLLSSFKGENGKVQIINLIKSFYMLGCQQLQLNMVSISDLIDAQNNPEKYQDLVVRVWGWSAYFCNLDKEFQDHLIARQYYA